MNACTNIFVVSMFRGDLICWSWRSCKKHVRKSDVTWSDMLACLKLLKLFKCLLSSGMTGKSGRRLVYLPIACVVQLYDFWKENDLLATSINEYCGWFLSGIIRLIDWHCMDSVDFRNSKWRTVNRKYIASVEWQWISAKLQQLTLHFQPWPTHCWHLR